MKIEITSLQDIKPYYNNPRDNAGAVPAVVESFKRYGFIKPIICDKDYVIIAGHTRYIAAFQLGLTQVPVVISDMDEERAKLFRIADNKLAEKSEFDETALIEELKGLQVPENLQAFFFENISEMVNFSFNDFQGVPQDYYNYDDESINEESDSNEDEVGDNFSSLNKEEDFTADDEDLAEEDNSDYNDLYRVKIVDGVKTMKVICPYCGNIESITLD